MLMAMEMMRMSKWTSRQKILLGCAAMALAMFLVGALVFDRLRKDFIYYI